MSIINQTLRELDARKASTGGMPLPTPLAPRPHDWRPAIAGLLVSVVATLTWLKFAALGEAAPPLTLSETRAAAPRPAPSAAIPPGPSTPAAAAGARAVPSTRLAPVAALAATAAADREAQHPGGDGPRTSPRAAALRGPVGEIAPEAALEPLIRKDFIPPSADAEAEARYRRAESLARSGRENEAQALLHDAIRIAPGHAAARQLLATVLHEAGKNDEAEAVLAEGLRAAPERSWFALSLARMQAERGDEGAAAATLLDGIDRRAVDAEYRATLAALLLRLDRPGDAAWQYEQALAMAPGRGRWWMGLGLALEGEGKTAAARAAYDRALGAGDLPETLVEFVQSKLGVR